ncbi:MAG: hypothetical protein AUH92_03050 [Acidobacteria bacterium 13_1_40CM_4_69_4]|nr:MAG: hypothetical protein AUH92_03050 [Acidobacteria bacterium 13_1_40CM_4_69_4]
MGRSTRLGDASLVLVFGLVLIAPGPSAAGPVAGACAVPAPPQVPRAPAPEPPPDLQEILAEAQTVQVADVAAWRRYRFSRRAEREELGDDGEVEEREAFEFVVTPDGDGFDEELVRQDGREPKSGEKEHQRRAASFTKHYRTLIQGAGGEEIEGGYSLSLLLHMSSYRYAGRETRNGVECYRLDFSPDDSRPKGSGLAWRVASVMQGSLWITVAGYHVAVAEAETTRRIPIALSLAKVREVRVSLESEPVGADVWLPRRIEMLTRARVLIKSIRRRNRYTYSEFSPAVPPA